MTKGKILWETILLLKSELLFFSFILVAQNTTILLESDLLQLYFMFYFSFSLKIYFWLLHISILTNLEITFQVIGTYLICFIVIVDNKKQANFFFNFIKSNFYQQFCCAAPVCWSKYIVQTKLNKNIVVYKLKNYLYNPTK